MDIYSTFGTMTPGQARGSVASGTFAADIAQAAADGLAADLDPALPVVVCGHSLGGALATLLVADLTANTPLKPQAWTFASPRVGDAVFAATLADGLDERGPVPFWQAGSREGSWCRRGAPTCVIWLQSVVDTPGAVARVAVAMSGHQSIGVHHSEAPDHPQALPVSDVDASRAHSDQHVLIPDDRFADLLQSQDIRGTWMR